MACSVYSFIFQSVMILFIWLPMDTNDILYLYHFWNRAYLHKAHKNKGIRVKL